MILKNYTLSIFLFLGSLFTMVSSTSAIPFSSMSFEDIRAQEGGFMSAALSTACRISPAGEPLTNAEKDALLRSIHLSQVHTLNFSHQGIDDEFIRKLSQNTSLKRLINLDLSYNTDITIQSLYYILESDIMGSLRDLPQISGRYGLPSTTIFVNVKGTSIEGELGEINRSEFHIDYRHPITNKEISEPVDYAVKFVEVS